MPTGRVWYLTHRPVFQTYKQGKFRIVQDAALTYKSLSLNSALLKEPYFLPSLIGILALLCEHKIAIVTNIKKCSIRSASAQKTARFVAFSKGPQN